MKFLVQWELHEGQLHDTLRHFASMSPEQEQEAMGSDIKLIGRWHDLASGSGVAICESTNQRAIAAWALQWNTAMNIEITPVLDDEETRAIGKAI